ncbi:hypothetical protein C8J57DRAFT_687256 [Mycena rebaudengoi]|nr:hypothetical protein C8J57DRAFT_687256 [Mycena rebaudengoi]
MADPHPRSSPGLRIRSRITPILREFTIILTLAFLCNFAILYALQHHLQLFLRRYPASVEPSSPVHTLCQRISLEIATLSPLIVLCVTAACTSLLFLPFGLLALVGRSPFVGDAPQYTVQRDPEVGEPTHEKIRPNGCEKLEGLSDHLGTK